MISNSSTYTLIKSVREKLLTSQLGKGPTPESHPVGSMWELASIATYKSTLQLTVRAHVRLSAKRLWPHGQAQNEAIPSPSKKQKCEQFPLSIRQ